MNRYAELDNAIHAIHNALQMASSSTPQAQIDALVAEDERLSIELREIDENDHAQVEAYRSAMGWKPCLKCQGII